MQLRTLVREKQWIIDTCSLMDEGCPPLFDRLIPLMRQNGKKMLIPKRVYEELCRHARQNRDEDKKQRALRGLRQLIRLMNADCLSLRGEPSDHFADNAIKVALSVYRHQYDMLLITQDKKLTRDILRLNEMHYAASHPVAVLAIGLPGELIMPKDGENRSSAV